MFEFNLLFFFYYGISKNEITKKSVKTFIIVFNLLLIISSFFYGSIYFYTVYNTITPVFGGVMVSIILMLYLREILLSEEIINYRRNIFFWITTGLLFYYLGTLPLAAIFDFMKKGSGFTELYNIQFLLIIIMHSCFLIGLLWGWKKVK